MHLPSDDVMVHRCAPVTRPVRTLLDLSPALGPVLLEKTVDEGLIAGLWGEAELVALVERSSGRPGVDRLRRVMAARASSPAASARVPLEGRAGRALASLGPFETGHQIVLDGRVYVIDIAWPAYKVAVECDGWTVRSRSRSKFDHDRRKDNHLASHGWTVVHLTSAMSDDEMRAAVVRVLLRAAAARA